MILKIDRPIVSEFLGELDSEDVISNVSRCKTYRVYVKKGGDIEDLILVLTPLMVENENPLNEFLNTQRAFGTPLKAIEHKRGKNYVYTFEKE